MAVSNNENVPAGTMQSVLRSLKVLEAVAELQPVGLSRLARTLSLPKSTVARILKTLEHACWIAPEGEPGDQQWTITARALAVGSNVARQVDLREIARPTLVRLGAETDENIHLSVPDGHSMVLIDKVHSSRSVQTISQIGQRAPMYMTASGWAYLSRLRRDQIDTYIPDELVAATDTTIVDRDSLLAEIDQVRERGYAVNPGRWRADVAAIGAAVVNNADRPVGAVSISMPSYRLVADLYEPYGELIRNATAELSALL
jgi:IclR family transcriptional regulator, acetate operon repressor